MKVMATNRAHETLKEIVNGSKEKIDLFITKLKKDGINKKDYKIFLKNSNEIFYYYKCKNIYVIFTIIKDIVTFVELLTPIKFKEIRAGKSL